MTSAIPTARPTVVSVLGMHRSGTSALTGSLERHGLFVGDVNRSAPHNPKGNNEHQPIRLLHDAVLAENGGSWHSPPARVVWTPERRSQLRRIVETFGGHPVWGFKDPRTLLTLDGWLDEVPDLVLVGTFRHPQSVVRSLVARQPQFGEEKAMELWIEHNQRLVRLARSRHVHLVSFDADPETYEQTVARLASTIGLSPRPTTDVFFDPSLRDATASWSGVPDRAVRLYEQLSAEAL